jgi:hypothetical protein
MKRLVILLPVLLALQVGVQPALAWTWPVDGPVLRPFELGADPYAGGQHRGVDIGSPLGAAVRAPSGGTVSFAGTVAANGRCVTIQTADGYSVTLVHLGQIGVMTGAVVEEGAPIGAVGPSGEPELSQPNVHLGIRVTADPHGYVDPLALLPPRRPSQPDADPAPTPEPAPVPTPATAEGRQGQSTVRPTEQRRASKPVRHRSPVNAKGAARARRSGAEASSRIALQRSARGPTTAAARRSPHSFEAAAVRLEATAPSGARPTEGGRHLLPWAFAAAALVAGLAVLRRQLSDAVAADGAAAVLLEPVVPPAEDACALGLGQEDRVVLDRDLERVLLPQTEALPDLDRDDNSAKLVDVPDDPRPRHSSQRVRCGLDRLSRGHGLQTLRRPTTGSRVSVPA